MTCKIVVKFDQTESDRVVVVSPIDLGDAPQAQPAVKLQAGESQEFHVWDNRTLVISEEPK